MEINKERWGWTLVEAKLGRSAGRSRVRLRGKHFAGTADVFEILLPVLLSGRVHELAWLPEDTSGLLISLSSGDALSVSMFMFRRVGVFERVWRMANRGNGTFRRLSAIQREKGGITYWKMFFNLSDSYRLATRLRENIPYSIWLERFDELDVNDERLIGKHISRFTYPLHFNVLVVADGSAPDSVQKTLASLGAQIYRDFACVVVDAESATNTVSDGVNGAGAEVTRIAQKQMAAWLEQVNPSLANDKAHEWVIILQAGDVLAPHALYWLASEVSAKPDAAIIYADDDEQDALGQRCRPRFKPDWSLAHLRATNFVGDAVALRGDVVASAGGLDPDCFRFGNYDLLLRVVDAIGEDRDKIVHIPAVLLHTGIAGDMTAEMRAWNMAALRAHLVRNGVSGEVSETLPGCWRVRYRLPESPPLVSIIVPTRDRLELIQRCLESVLEKTTYPRYEILVVDNQSADPEVLAFLDRMGKHEQVRVLRYDRSFNFSAMNNLAVEQAKGEVVCLLNNDTEVISPDWLDEMIGHLLQSKVGVVGAKLYFPDGRVQHAGDLVGVGGVANHAHAFLQSNEPGYCNRAMVAQDMSAVTAACMVTRRSLYLELGGLDEKNLPVAFNDVDYCLRASEAGYRVIWTPYAELYHHESVSRGKDLTPEKKKRAKSEVVYMRKRWRRVMRNDPYYNPNLSYERPDFSLSHAPMVKKPWVNGK